MSLKTNVEKEILMLLAEKEMSKYQLAEASGRSYSAVHKAASNLLSQGLIATKRKAASTKNPKITVEYYTLTEKGLREVENLAVQREAAEELALDRELEKEGNLRVEVRKRLYRAFFPLDLQPRRGFFHGLAVVPILLDLVKTLVPDKLANEYLDFLAELYVQAPKMMLGRRPRSWDDLRCAWMLADDIKHEAPGFLFDFKSAWDSLYRNLSDNLKRKMAERDIDKEKVFRCLKIFSFPVTERRRVSKILFNSADITKLTA